MKKVFALIISVLLIFSYSVIASAEEAKYSTAGDLYQAWCEIFPDYICGVWSTDGSYDNLTFGIQNNELGNAGKKEMLELVKNDSTMTFVYQEYSRNYLLRIQREIDEYMKKDLGLISTGLDDKNNCIVLGILEERKDDADTKNMLGEITEKYGKAVSNVVEYTDGIYLLTTDENDDLHAQPFLFYTMGIVIFLLIGMVFVIQRRNIMLLQTNNGTTVTATTSLSAKDVEGMVKKSNYSVPTDLDQKVINTINQNKNTRDGSVCSDDK